MRLLQIDAFTDAPFRGNPAAVCLVDSARDEKWMQDVAAETNLPATAFLQPRDDGWSLRWFAPAGELAFCGHGTLASAHALWEEQLLNRDETARFHTKAGVLTATRNGDVIELDFPATPASPVDAPPELLPALRLSNATFIGKNHLDYIVSVPSVRSVLSVLPNHQELRKLDARGVIITAPSDDPNYDFVSRFFAPGAGIDEDSVTGSAHCCLAPYWSSRLGKTELTGYQASPRGGMVRMRLEGDRVKLGGRAVTVVRGELTA